MSDSTPFKALSIGPNGWAHGLRIGEYLIDRPEDDDDDTFVEITEIMNAEDCAAMIATFKAEGEDLLVDRDHSADMGDSTEAYAWVTDMRPTKDGIEVLLVPTDIGQIAIAGKRWKYLSPVFEWEDFTYEDDARLRGHPRRIARFAFTNRPRMRGIRPVVNSDRKASGSAQATHTDTKPKPTKGSMDYKAKLLALLGLADEATDEEIQAALDLAEAAQADAVAEVAMNEAGLPDDEKVREPVKNAYRDSEEAGKNALNAVKAAISATNAAHKTATTATAAAAKKPIFRALNTEARTTPPALHAAEAGKSAARTSALNSVMAANPGMDRTRAWDQTRRENPQLF